MDRFLNTNKRNSADKESMSSTSGATVKKRKYHKYDDSYLEFSLTSTGINGEERQQFVSCMKVLAAECMLPSKLKRHLEANHHSMVDKPRDFFTGQLKEFKQQKIHFLRVHQYQTTFC
jgi:hypothetical protein